MRHSLWYLKSQITFRFWVLSACLSLIFIPLLWFVKVQRLSLCRMLNEQIMPQHRLIMGCYVVCHPRNPQMIFIFAGILILQWQYIQLFVSLANCKLILSSALSRIIETIN